MKWDANRQNWYRVQIVRLARTGKVTMECMIGATSKVHHVEIGKKKDSSTKSLPLVFGLGKSRSHLKDSFQGSWRRMKTDEEEVKWKKIWRNLCDLKAVVFCRQEIVLNSVARLRWALKLWAPRKRSKKFKHPFLRLSLKIWHLCFIRLSPYHLIRYVRPRI